MKERVRISVGELATFRRQGDINFRFSGRSSALEGIKGHQIVQASRSTEYQAERPLKLEVEYDDYLVTVQGRADGLDASSDPMTLEEIKTVRMPVSEIPLGVQRLHWLQLHLYGHLLVQELGNESVQMCLCYFDLDSQRQTRLEEVMDASQLAQVFDDTLEYFVSLLDRRRAWRRVRDRTIESAQFPYTEFRPGQRDMSVAIYRNMAIGEQLILQAPTGIGKTMGALFPAIKGLSAADYDQVFYLSAKTSGQAVAESAVSDLHDQGLRLRQLTLTAKDKICFNPGLPCDPDYCSYAKGYYDRLGSALNAVLESDMQFDRACIEERARRFDMCPFEFSLDISTSADVIVCDYNYVFDPSVYLRRFFERTTVGKYALLVDETHNLVDRGRTMYSATLSKGVFLVLARNLKQRQPALTRRLRNINRLFLSLRNTERESFDAVGFVQFAAIPERLMANLKQFCELAEDYLRLNEASDFLEELLSVYFDSLRFLRTSEMFDDCYACLLRREGKDIHLQLFCLNPAPQLRLGFERMASSVCFSATMRPQLYYQTLLGVGDDTLWYQVPSPFAAENLGVLIASHIRTNYRERHAYIDELKLLITAVVRQKCGNYLVYFPSYAYLNRVYEAMGDTGFRMVRQTPTMDDHQRQRFLDRFEVNSTCTLVGFAVMGGVFAEGVDLKGDRLIGAIIVGVGLPQVGVERDLIREHFDEGDGGNRGFEFAYQYPGMNRVLQTAGRVIRDYADRGIVVLVDSRFTEARYRDLLPSEWQVQQSYTHDDLQRRVADFWMGVPAS